MKKQFLLFIFFKLVCKNFAIFNSLPVFTKYKAIYEELESRSKQVDVRNFVRTILDKALPSSQICFITDSIYEKEIYYDSMSASLNGRLIYILSVIDQESFEYEPSEKIITMLKIMKVENCDYYIILITNGIQMVDFLRYSDQRRLFKSNANFIMLHDYRLFKRDNHYIWKRITNVIFIRKLESERHKNWYEISTVPFPAEIRNIYVSRVLNYFIPPNRYLKKKIDLYDEKKSQNLNANTMNVVIYSHSPAVVKNFNENDTEIQYSGLEVDLIETIANKMNFKINYFETENNKIEKWGRRISEDNYTGLLNVMNKAHADIALADLFQTDYHLKVMDLTVPYTTECLTFITPEVLTDNSWKALISPFSFGMWIGTLVSLICIILIFYAFSNFYLFIKNPDYMKQTIYGKNTLVKKDVFDKFSACVVYSYSMLLLVSMPKLPDRWSVRLLTGWWWLYCVLVVVAYRASLTSILANPDPKLTIDSLEMLANSKLACGMWGEQNKNFFLMSSDRVTEKIIKKLQEVDFEEDGIARVEKGEFAYFESSVELKRLRFEYEKKQSNKLLQSLHIMEECVINMPISIGLDKNSPLKKKMDQLIRYAMEGGLIIKWFKDAIKNFESSIEESPAEALMDLKKFYAALVVLFTGYLISLITFIMEIVYWKYFIQRHPQFDKYFGRIITDCELETLKITNRRMMKRNNNLKDRQIYTTLTKSVGH
ncbi:hypothetical protein PVAND_009190 [Polypedilum vanderplanki]|uniref:Uncharacterized protein n=1 Tax=Polypedilum vanderplanki TaxID=319348 RepID=A0A9J6CCR3_POLVA|nr:hypothetical protein PVAND_009190 [Polypedilum vanderplanki]